MAESEKLPVIDVVCALLLDESGNVLVARRPLEKSLGGLWEFPGGKVEDGETLSDALVREIREELGTEVVVESDGLQILGTFDHGMNDVIIRLHPIVCRLSKHAKPPEALEHLELQWLPINEESEIDWAPGDRRIFATLREWHQKSRRPRPRSSKNLFRGLFWMTFSGYVLFYLGTVYDIWIALFLSLGMLFPALPLSLVMNLDILMRPSSNWWHNLGDHAQIVLFLAFNAWLLTRVWRWLTK